MLKKLFRKDAGPLAKFGQKLVCFSTAVGMQQLLRTIDFKIAYYDSTADPARQEYNEHCIHVFWHENMSILIPQWSRCPVTMLVSQHRDAEWLTLMSRFLGFNIVRGSSTRGGSSAIRQINKLSSKTSFSITPDGPQGPRRKMMLGPLFLASRLNMPLVPVGVGYENPHRFDTWDRFAVPKPFTRARVIFGPKVRVPAKLNRESLESRRNLLERLLNGLSGYAESWAVSGQRMLQEQVFQKMRRCSELQLQPHRLELDNRRIAA